MIGERDLFLAIIRLLHFSLAVTAPVGTYSLDLQHVLLVTFTPPSLSMLLMSSVNMCASQRTKAGLRDLNRAEPFTMRITELYSKEP